MPIKPQSVGFYQFLYNGEKYDYPWRESLESVYPVADEIVVAECHSTDDTWEKLQEFASTRPKIRLIRHDWVTHFSELSKIGNACVPEMSSEWVTQIQADEVLHENSYPFFEQLKTTPASEFRNLQGRIATAFRTHYTHFLANYETEFDFCYQSLIRIAKRGSGWWLHGDACQLDGGNKNLVIDSPVQVFHYGKVHEGHTGFEKEWDFQALFKDIGFPDPKMLEMKEKLGESYCDYLYLFKEQIAKGTVRRFTGTHPAVMKDRIARFKEGGWEQVQSRMDEALKLS
jgi:glycosyltransferase involved in cell wall biosynthesis